MSKSMEKARAAGLMETARSIGEHLNKLHELSERLTTDPHRNEFRTHIAELMGIVTTDIMLPIIAEYPDLDPDKST
jgi:hypothetical protein